MGECGELIAACQNYHRARKFGCKKETIENVMSEAVDVFFMIQQIRFIDPLLFDHICQIKEEMVIKKLENENEKIT